jgi:dienelactone hydrolase
MRKWWIWGLLFLLLSGGLAGGYYYCQRVKYSPKGAVKEEIVKPLVRYDFDELLGRGGVAGDFEILGEIEAIKERRERYGEEDINFSTREIRFKSEGKWVSGMMNYYPERSSLSKVIIMVRGYAEKEGYYVGSGSYRMADELAKNGFVTISVDFLGFGNSEAESTEVLEARFEKVVTVMDLIATVKSLPWVDKDSIGIWAHSNGGQIVLSVGEVLGERIPMVLWAPMTQPFPKSVLETIEADSPVKGILEDFEKRYDSRRYAFENYYEWLNSPVLIFQGDRDEWCEVSWQEKVVEGINKAGGEAELRVTIGDDHNFSKNWQKVAAESVYFLENMLR